MKQLVRYFLWFVFCAFACYGIAQKDGSIAGPASEVEVVLWGGALGLGFAVASNAQQVGRLRVRLVIAVLWIATMTACYVLVFRQTGYSTGVIWWGLLFSLPGPLLWILRTPGVWRPF